MKDSKGHYCILDLSCTDYDYKVFDVATYLALFPVQIEVYNRLRQLAIVNFF